MIEITRRRLAAAALVLAGLAAAPAAVRAEDLAIRHAQGETTVSGVPRKVFVFDPAALDTLDALGVEIAGVPSGSKPDHLRKYNSDAYLKIGSLFEPDLELINAEKPDLVIVGGRSAAKYADLAGLAPTIDLSVDRAHFLAGAEANAEMLARIFGKEARAAELIGRLDASTEELRGLAAGAGTALAIITTGGRMSAHGPGSRFGVLYADYGFEPAAEGLDTATHGQPISFEFLLEKNPDWLFVVDRDAAIGREGTAARQLLDNEIVHETTAWKKDQIVYVDPANWYLVGGGLTALQENVDEIIAALGTN